MTMRPLPEPSIGRDVHYVSYGTPGGEYPSACRAAKITAVNGGVNTDGSPDTLLIWFVSLCVFNPTGLFFAENVKYSEQHEGGTWHWPERVDSPAEAAARAEEADRQFNHHRTQDHLADWVKAFNDLHREITEVRIDMARTPGAGASGLGYWIDRIGQLVNTHQGPRSTPNP